MKRLLATVAVLACALRAESNDSLLTPRAIHVLTPIDELPTRGAVSEAFGNGDALRAIAQDRAIDLGIQLRAIRALAMLCPAPPQACGNGNPGRETLLAIVAAEQAHPNQPASVLRLRAAIEALGATRSETPADIDRFGDLLSHDSRDVRSTAVRALRGICAARSVEKLKSRSGREPVAQVQVAIDNALSLLRNCTN